jgi:hypothetical protein
MAVLRFAFAALISLLGAQTQTLTDDGPASTPEQRLAFARKAAGEYHFQIAGRETSVVKLHPEPLLRWNNQVVREDDGMLFLWTDRDTGRPLAAAQFFLAGPVWHHEFQSLSQNGFAARFEGEGGANWAWQPTRGGIEFVRAENIDAPADSPNQRLRQMKSIAERFSAAVDPDARFESPEQLRLLTTPIYRYSAKNEGVEDGALFAIVQGTNPEVLVLVEADTTDPASKVWRYGFARMSCFNLRVYRDRQVVWKQDRAPVPTPDRASPYFFRQYAQRDGSAEVEVPVAKTKE